MKESRAGILRKNLSGELEYYSFVPTKLPPIPGILIDNELSKTLIELHKLLAILDDRSKNIPDMNLFVSMYIQKEALLSSQIEGTQATLENIFDPEIEKNINLDVNDVINYIKDMNYALERMKTLPLCNRLLIETHKVLLSGVRGREKNPGEFRISQNLIGGQGSTLKIARYIPPNVTDMQDALSDLEKYINLNDSYDPLINVALIHYQFETIHPFLDGNGRIGRLLIILYLIYKEILHTPSLYLSYYLKINRTEYYDRMMEVRKSGNYEQWIKFFLNGMLFSAKSTLESANKMIELKNKDKDIILNYNISNKRKETVNLVFKYILSHPLIDISKTAKDLGISYNTICKSIDVLCELNILKKISVQKRNKKYIYEKYFNILNDE